jgi:uncharacterized protein YecE (DUF72 family)
MNDHRLYIGTSGWHYKHWMGNFYPAGTRPAGFLAHYLRSFFSVEINNSFYRLPSVDTLAQWKAAVPQDFVFAVKASRYITHMKKLKEPQQSFSLFMSRVQVLGEKLGPILFQLPPVWRFDENRFRDFLAALPSTYRYTFEFRDRSWYNDRVYELLETYRCAFCVYEIDYHLSPLEVTTDFVYVRLHGPAAKYDGSYSDMVLSNWAARCQDWLSQGKSVYFYFDNDMYGHAPVNARRLLELSESPGLRTPEGIFINSIGRRGEQ